nr:hypothetical protein [Nocardia sp. alder85J]
MTDLTIWDARPGDFPRIEGKYGPTVGKTLFTWHNGHHDRTWSPTGGTSPRRFQACL